jgi:hypothetical protein
MAHRNDLIPLDAQAVTPTDGAFVNLIGVFVGGAGNLRVRTAKGNLVTFTGVPAGTQIALGIVEVLATSTTATNIVGYVAQ